MDAVLSEGSRENHRGSPTRPEGEVVIGHGRAQRAEEVSPTRSPILPGGSHETDSHEPSLKTASASQRREIVRSSVRFRIEPWEIAEDPEAHKAGECGGIETCSACYLYHALRTTQRESAHAANLITRHIWRRDTAALDAFLLQHHRPPRSAKEFPYPKWAKSELYRLATQAFPGLAPINITSLVRMAEKKWKQLRWESLVRVSARPPHWKSSNPIPIHRQAIKGFGKISNRVRLMEVQLRSLDRTEERPRHRVKIPFLVKDSYQSKIIQNLASGDWKMGTASVQEDAIRPGRWYLRIAYKRLVEEVPPDKRVAAINRGMRDFLVLRTWDDKVWRMSGGEIASYLKQIQARRREYQRGYRGSGRKGHGRKRSLQPIEKLAAKAERWRDTKCQTIAAEVTKWLVKQKITTLYIEDFTGIRTYAADDLGKHIGQAVQEWPYFKLQTCLVTALERAGLSVVQVGSANLSRTCPECGHTEKGNVDLKTWKLTCTACGWSRNLDEAACINVLARGEKSGGAVLVGPESLKKEMAKRGKSRGVGEPSRRTQGRQRCRKKKK